MQSQNPRVVKQTRKMDYKKQDWSSRRRREAFFLPLGVFFFNAAILIAAMSTWYFLYVVLGLKLAIATTIWGLIWSYLGYLAGDGLLQKRDEDYLRDIDEGYATVRTAAGHRILYAALGNLIEALEDTGWINGHAHISYYTEANWVRTHYNALCDIRRRLKNFLDTIGPNDDPAEIAKARGEMTLMALQDEIKEMAWHENKKGLGLRIFETKYFFQISATDQLTFWALLAMISVPSVWVFQVVNPLLLTTPMYWLYLIFAVWIVLRMRSSLSNQQR